MTFDNPLCLALDVPSKAEAVRWTERFAGRIGVFKIGLQLFLSEGPSVVQAVRRAGAERIFLDLKLHDIPNTVAASVRSAARSGADLLTIHCAGGPTMMAAAQAAAGSDLRLLGVTVLTSMDATELDAVGVNASPAAVVLKRARLAERQGLFGLVCAPSELSQLRPLVPGVCLVTPGIRMPGDARDDQKRVSTPAAALSAGADLLVLGRAIRNAASPEKALEAIKLSLKTVESLP